MYFGHHISTIEGGMVCTNDKEIYDILLSIRSHGWDRDWDKEKQEQIRKENNITDFNSLYTFYHPGFNLRATDLQAYIGLGQLEKLDYICEKREENFQKFQKGINNDFWKPAPLDNTFTSSFCYPIIHPKRTEIIEALIANDIEVRPLVCGTMGKQPFYTEKFGIKELKNCDVIDEFGLYVPNNPSLTDDEINLIINTINKIIN
jgi:CDP-6-deoxy-D-xylo-4-hexulose-3-dehydrase